MSASWIRKTLTASKPNCCVNFVDTVLRVEEPGLDAVEVGFLRTSSGDQGRAKCAELDLKLGVNAFSDAFQRFKKLTTEKAARPHGHHHAKSTMGRAATLAGRSSSHSR